MNSSSFLIYTVCQIFLHWSKIFPDFFISSVWSFQGIPHMLPKAAEQNSAGKQKKASANFSGAKTRCAHFPAGGIFVSGLAGQQPRVQRFPAACTFPSGANRPTSSISIHQPQRPTRQSPNAFFVASVFQTRKHEVHIFSASKTIASDLTGQYLPILFSYQPYNLQQDNSFHSGASRPTPSCPTSLQSPMPPDRQRILFRRQPANTSRRPSFHTGPIILNQPTLFLPAWPADALHTFPPLF